MRRVGTVTGVLITAMLAGCGGGDKAVDATEAFASRYVAPPTKPLIIRNATVFIGTGDVFEQADVLVVDGKIKRVGEDLSAPRDAREINAKGK